jgi:hypothetical protein
MTASDWRRKRRILPFVILFCTLSAFTADIFDFREELELFSCPDSGTDHDVIAGVMSSVAIEPELICLFYSAQPAAFVEVSSMHRFANGFRAPPSLS